MTIRPAIITPSTRPWCQSLRASLPQPGLGTAVMHSPRSRFSGTNTLSVTGGGGGSLDAATGGTIREDREFQAFAHAVLSTIKVLNAPDATLPDDRCSSSTSAPSTPSSSPAGSASSTCTPRSCRTGSRPPRSPPATRRRSSCRAARRACTSRAHRCSIRRSTTSASRSSASATAPSSSPSSSVAPSAAACAASTAAPTSPAPTHVVAARTPTSPTEQDVWMSHFDAITEPPAGFVATASTPRCARRRARGRRASHLGRAVPPRGRAHAARHGGAAHVPARPRRLRADVEDGVGHRRAGRRIRAQVGDGRVICALSGGVDSSVAAALVHRGDRPPAHVHLRRHRADAQGRERAGRRDVPAQHGHRADPRRRRRPLLRARSPASPSRRPSARRSASCSSASSRRTPAG